MRRLVTGGACACLMMAGIAPAWADALIERYAKSEGVAGLGGFESTTTTATTATAQRSQAEFQFTGSFLSTIQRMTGAGGDHVRITRLDRDVVWTLDPEHKTYTEAPLTRKAELERRPPGSGPAHPSKPESSDVLITRNEFKVQQTGATKAINGFPCEEYLVTWVVETLNQKTGETGKSTMTTHLWTTPETAEIREARAEEQAYARAYLQKLQLDMSPEQARSFGLAALAGATGMSEAEQQRALAQLSAEMAKVHGYPIVTEVEWRVADSGADAESRASQPVGSGGPPPGLGDLGSALGKLFGAGPPGGHSQASSAGAGGDHAGTGNLFNLYTEVKSIKVVPAVPARYEIPDGYSKK